MHFEAVVSPSEALQGQAPNPKTMRLAMRRITLLAAALCVSNTAAMSRAHTKTTRRRLLDAAALMLPVLPLGAANAATLENSMDQFQSVAPRSRTTAEALELPEGSVPKAPAALRARRRRDDTESSLAWLGLLTREEGSRGAPERVARDP